MPAVTEDALSEEFELFGVDLNEDFFPKCKDQIYTPYPFQTVTEK